MLHADGKAGGSGERVSTFQTQVTVGLRLVFMLGEKPIQKPIRPESKAQCRVWIFALAGAAARSLPGPVLWGIGCGRRRLGRQTEKRKEFPRRFMAGANAVGNPDATVRVARES